MKLNPTFFALLFIGGMSASAAQRLLPGTSLPHGMTVVESAQKKEVSEITNKALTYLAARDYAKLDEMAASLRASKASWSTGHLKLGDFYAGFSPSDETAELDWKKRLDALQDWVATRTNSITARVALAYTMMDYAWAARGSGWADTVTANGWKLFSERLHRAMQVLDEAQGLKEQCPISWSVRMRCALGLQYEKGQFNSIFKQATNSTPDYPAYYFRKAIYLLPRWHGEPGEWEADLTKHADQIGGEKGDEVYAQVVWCIHQNVSSTNIFKEYKLSWPRVDRGFAAIIKQYPHCLAARNEGAHLAVLVRDQQAARKYFDQCESKIEPTIWKGAALLSWQIGWAYRQ